jgi:hemolysin III
MSRKDMIAQKARRKSTLKSLKQKKRSRLRQLKNDYEESIRTINIQYSEDPERLKAKYAAEDYAKSEKAKKRAENRIARVREMIEIEKTSRKLSASEEIGSSIVQGLGACIFIAATAILDTIALNYAKNFFTFTAVFYSLFGGSMILMYLFSLLQHAL